MNPSFILIRLTEESRLLPIKGVRRLLPEPMREGPRFLSAKSKTLEQRSKFFLVIATCVVASFVAISSSQFPSGFSNNPKNTRQLRHRWDLGGKVKFVPGEVLVRVRPGVSERMARKLHAQIGTQLVRTFRAVNGLQLVKLPDGLSVKGAIRRYRGRPDVSYAEPNYIVRRTSIPNDPLFPEEWGLNNTGQAGGTVGADIHAPSAWDLSTGNKGVVVAMLDSGIDYTHPDLAANVWSAPTSFTASVGSSDITCPSGSHGINVVAGSCDPMDDNGHGTAVSGIIGAVGNNNGGMSGINWNVNLMACKFLNSQGEGSESGAIACLDFVKALKESGVNIVATNNSWGGDFNSQALLDAIQVQEQDGILFVAAAGNSFEDNDLIPTYPANFFLPNILSVAATTRTDDVAGFSNLGRHTVALGAPGQDILSALPHNSYGLFTGTSAAAPFVTGVAALLKAQNPNLDWRAIKNLILTGGDTVPSLSETVSGRRLDAYGSITCSNSTTEARLLPVPAVVTGAVGTPINLSVLNINCGQPKGEEQITVSPNGATVALADDGTGSDQVAGDGIYSGQWTPPALGSYTLNFPGGDSVGVDVLKNYTASPVSTGDFNYRTITGTNLNLADDSVAEITSPFPIAFGTGSFTNLFVSSNGTISFTDAFGGFFNEALPIVEPPYEPSSQVTTLVAPFWDDLYPVAGSNQNVYWEVDGAAPNRELVVEWRDVRSFQCSSDSTATVKFQVVFFENSSDVLFNYADATFGGDCSDEDRGAGATVGIQVAPQVAMQWSYGGQDIGDGTGILWQPAGVAPPANPVPAISSISPTSTMAGSTDLTVTVNGSNFVADSRVRWGDSDRLTSYVSTTQLKTLLPASDLAQGTGGCIIAVFNPPPGGGTSNCQNFLVNNPVPVITSLSPSSAAAGGFSFPLTVYGTGFGLGGSAVYWNGQQLQTTWISSTQLSAGVLLPQIAQAGTAQVTVVNLLPGGGTSAPATFTITSGTLQANLFAPSQSAQTSTSNSSGPIAGGSPPPEASDAFKAPYRFLGWNYEARMGADHLNRYLRRRYGLAIPVRGLSQTSNMTGGQGTALSAQALSSPPPVPGFLFRKALPAGFIPTSVATGDFNKDGWVDWVVSNAGSNDLWLYLGKGDGTSQLPLIIPLTGNSPIWVATADLRGNGILDLVVAEVDSQSVGILLGNGDGTFGPETTYYVPAPPLCLQVKDFTGNGYPDILVGLAGSRQTGPLALLPGNGKGSFGPADFLPDPSLSANSAIIDMAAADLNGDGLPDVVLNNGAYLVSAYVNRGDGTFKMSQGVEGSFIPGLYYTNLALGDLNGDGCADLVVLDTFSLAERFLGGCDGTFRNKSGVTFFGTGDIDYGIALADINGDGHLDIVSSGIVAGVSPAYGWQSGRMLSVLMGDGLGGFSSPKVYRGEPSMYSLACADLNGDGHPDIVTANQDTDSTSVFLNDGQGGFGNPQGGYLGYTSGGRIGLINVPVSRMFAKDLNGDGKPDLSVLDAPGLYPNPYNFAALLNNSDGTFSLPLRSDVLDSTFFFGDLALADFRSTGRQDLLIIGRGAQISNGSPVLSFAANNGGGTFGFPSWAATPGAQGIIASGDFNGDGKLDFVALQGTAGTALNSTTSELTVFLGNGSGGFTAGYTTTFDANSNDFFPAYVFVGDFNHDGKLDVITQVRSTLQGTQGHDVFEFLGNGNGTFAPAKDILQNFGPFVLGDLNHDGLPDIIELVEPLTTLPIGAPVQYAIYLGQPNGTFKLLTTYQPYAGIFNFTALDVWQPVVGDFNGDGNLDIAVFQSPPDAISGNAYEPLNYFQILAGNGDGTFTPTYTIFDILTAPFPEFAADLNGDGRADLIELDGATSSYHVIPAAPGPSMQIRLVSDPVIGTNGNIQIDLAVASSSSTTVNLSASEPAISIASSVTIPAGSVTQEVPFQIGSAFNPYRVFAIQAQLGAETETAYGTQATSPVGFRLSLMNSSFTVAAGQMTPDYGPRVFTIGGYSTTVQLQCTGLPAGTTCQFGSTSLQLPTNAWGHTTLTVSTPANLALGSYPFTVTATDGSVSQQVTATLNVGDFTISISPAKVATTPSNFAQFSLTIGAAGGFDGYVLLSLSGLPTGAFVTNFPDEVGAGTYGLTIQTQSVQAGSYTFTITGSTGFASHIASATLEVQDFLGSVSPTSATIAVGSSATFNVSLTSQLGLSGTTQLGCTGAPAGTACTFNPPTLTLVPNGTASSTMTVTVASRPAFLPPSQDLKLPRGPLFSALWYWIAVLLLVLIAASDIVFERRRWRIVPGILTFLILCVVLAGLMSCGGGGGSTIGPSPPPPQSKSFTITVRASEPTSTSQFKTIGTVNITVP